MRRLALLPLLPLAAIAALTIVAAHLCLLNLSLLVSKMDGQK